MQMAHERKNEMIKEYMKKIRAFFQKNCPAVSREFSLTTKVYKNDKDETPAYTYHRAGKWRLNLWQGLAVFTLAIFVFASRKKKR